ncbi:MAG TPA: suppressor of fused domain protein [Candidatus Dormibacteraeota bacterium]|nr:suppressor of fused domain protein [Candidatus Dormibacteraeota bacterium]
MKSRAERYLDRIVELAGGREPRINPIETSRPEVHLPPVVALSFQDMPEPGLISGFTYGLSLARHPLWQFGRPELAITVFSKDVGWPISIALMADRLRGECPFEFGNTINVGETITDETHLAAFAIFAPPFPDNPDDCKIDVGDDVPVILTGCYPIHRTEMDFIERNGLEAFWKLDWDAYDVQRGPAIFD